MSTNFGDNPVSKSPSLKGKGTYPSKKQTSYPAGEAKVGRGTKKPPAVTKYQKDSPQS